jgi:hypothetical protein
MATTPEPDCPSPVTKKTESGVLLHEAVDEMPALPAGTFARINDDTLVCVARPPGAGGRGACLFYTSRDGGSTWTSRPLLGPESPCEPAPTGALVLTRRGTLIVAFANLAERHWTWDDTLKDAPGARLPCCAAASSDGGETWHHVQTLHDDWTGAVRDAIETRDGRVVVTSMKMLHDPGRHSVLTYVTDDDGETWGASNVIDLGGNGHHGGVTEGTLVELADGRLLQYIRTNWGQFWRSESRDGGLHWHPYGPSGVEASSAPGILKRLSSGRIALVWNRLYPEGRRDWPLKGGDGVRSATPVANHREELSISFSDDECETWSAPVVIARKPGGEISYPAVFEPEPSVLWITCHRWLFRVRLRESDFVT